MTEAEWLACEDPQKMLAVSRKSASERKDRLLLCACFRRAALTAEESLNALAVAERFADGVASDDERKAALMRLGDPASGGYSPEAFVVIRAATHWPEPGVHGAARMVAYRAVPYRLSGWDQEAWQARHDAERRYQTSLLRDIFGNPFRPVAIDPDWRTSTVVALAKQMYESRDFSPMPILADALQDAGCDCDDILNHCRGPGPHVKGCWVVDLVRSVD